MRSHATLCVLDLLDPRLELAPHDAVLNPLRSEGEAFRLLLYVLAVAVVVIALVLALRAIF